MRTDPRTDRMMLWVAARVPFAVSQRIRWRVQDRRLDRAMNARARAIEALHEVEQSSSSRR